MRDIEGIEDGAFDLFVKLKTLDLSKNKLRRFNKWFFKDATRLVYFFLNDNEIEDISSDVFDSLSKLATLDLSNIILKK